MNEFGYNPLSPANKEATGSRRNALNDDIVPIPRLKSTHLIDLSSFVTVDNIPLTVDDLDSAIQIANGTEDDFNQPVARGRTISLSSITYHTTDAGAFEEYNVDSALRYLAARPSAPLRIIN